MTASVLRGILALVLLTVGVPGLVAASAPQNDLGTGSDAPDDPASAIDAAPGGAGELAPGDGDQADWYRIPAMPNKGIHVVLDSTTGGIGLAVMDDGLQGRWDSNCCFGPEGGQGWCCGPGTHIDTYIGPIGPAYRIGVSACCQGGPYSLSVDYVDLYDLSIDSVRILNDPVTTDVTGALSVGTQKTIEVTVTNLGPGPSYWSGVGAWVQHEFSDGRDLGGVGLPVLPAGGSATVRIPWDATGEVGDVRVDVNVGGALQDGPGEHSHAENRSYVLAGNIGGGADLVAHHTGRCDANGCVNANSAYGPWGKGIWVNQNQNDGNNTYAHVGTHPGTAHAFVSRHDSDRNVNVDVGAGNDQASVCPTDGDPCLV